MDNPLIRWLGTISPSIIKSLALMSGGIVFLFVPAGVRLGKVPSALMLFTSSALLAGATVPLRKWEQEFDVEQKLLRAEQQIAHATLTAQTLGAVQTAKQKYLPQAYDPQTLTTQVKAEIISNVPALPPAAQEQPKAEPTNQADIPLLDLRKLLNTTLLMIWGTQGGGKTTLAKMLCKMRESEGHSVMVADPHGSAEEWGSWEIIGAGRDYKMLNQYLGHFDKQVTEDYQLYSHGQRDFPYRTLIVDEFTQWADRCKNAPMFVKSSCSDLRKIKRCVVLITHSDTLTGLGNAQGLRDAINRSAVKLELETALDENGEYYATGYGWLQYPKQPRQRVKIPRHIPVINHDDRLPDEQLDQIASEVIEELYSDPIDQLKKMWNLETVEPEHEKKKILSKPAQAILEKYIQKKMFGIWIDAKWVKNYVFYRADFKQFSQVQTREFLKELAQSGRGSVEGEENSLRWYFDPKYDSTDKSSTE